MTKIVLAALSIASALLIVTCGESSKDKTTENWLVEAIRSVPDDYGVWHLMFTNGKQARQLADAQDFEGIPDFLAGGPFPWTYEALAPPADMLGNIFAVYDRMGIDFHLTNHSLWVDPPFYDVPKFMVVEGGYQDAEKLSSTLKDMGYHTSAHNGVPYYRWLLGDVINLRRIRELRTNASLNFGLNTIAPIGEKLILSQREEWTKNLIEVHQGSRLSLYDLKHYRELAQAVGDEALAGAFVAPEFVEWAWTDMGVKPIERLERYTSGPDAWSDLEPYTVAIVGNGVRNGVVNTIVALHYSDPSGAERNAQELKRRWDSAKFQAEEGRVFLPPVKDPIAGICTPLETRTTAVGQSSILIGTCGTSEHRAVGAPMFDGLHSWYVLMEYKELHFLIPNLEEVIHAAAK